MLRFKIADSPGEFEQIHRLNHRTFAGEIPQHEPRADGRLVDRFHDENLYAVALREDEGGGARVVGMLALRGRRPFSLDGKLPDLDARLARLPAHRRPCEIRLLAIEAGERGGAAFRGLAETLLPAALAAGYDLALISGTPRQARLYRHVGFEPFGDPVGTAAAPYQPMFLTPAALRRGGRALRGTLPSARAAADAPTAAVAPRVNLLPGPAPLSPAVRAALGGTERSHREPAFRDELDRLRNGLCALAGFRRGGGADVQILMGSGTTANDAVAGQLSREPGPGLVCANGEFGDRLIDHAVRWGLEHAVHRRPWGEAFAPEALRTAAAGARWIWAVHGETSAGLLNDLETLTAVAAESAAALAVDAISSLGATPVDLAGVRWATSVSGKSLCGPPGLAFVFHSEPPAPPGRLPRALDLGQYAACGGVPFTLSSALVAATATALDECAAPGRFAEVAALTERLLGRLSETGLRSVAAGTQLPGVVSVAMPPGGRFGVWVERLAEAGFLVNRSGHLAERGWVQFAVVGRPRPADVDRLAEFLADLSGCDLCGCEG
ncbi:aminotransferase class V-fold PLP-dependent enzyme [Alienimonas californiensis]|uniref:2-aminoethylphosphonate--pyruvate transaminase n=1 Tax=Alienimonas californiensis TaxID=2527989 RepID=A0A517P3K3_9PLAN|nr:aminotransferase class V-fold PLP-dependent enzyme [Alienimonas californiensis]QDT13956.1 2-aminoethylphosphonate--pyruvate transaminase [Alienimonas californiensis]